MQLKGDDLSEKLRLCIGAQLKLTTNVMTQEHNKYLKPYGISNEQGLLLKYVYDTPGAMQTNIAEYLHKDKTTITRMIDTLVKKGKLERRVSSEDRRAFHIYVTKDTKKNVEKVSPHFEKNNEELEKIIEKKDYEITLKVLNQIKEYYRGLNK
jgi:DNA-binding MarR family transcriptional regulator